MFWLTLCDVVTLVFLFKAVMLSRVYELFTVCLVLEFLRIPFVLLQILQTHFNIHKKW